MLAINGGSKERIEFAIRLDILNDNVVKNSYLYVENDKAATMIANNKYKEVAEEYGTCAKYGNIIASSVPLPHNPQYMSCRDSLCMPAVPDVYPFE
ncbi:hypothetical protein [Clostridium estertheticum]|uniref:Uncharacterized protein n=1 Tax=Clostridium estertheticum TaxID=238834 RepID=A0A7Y3WRK9_9CLOT|nr:hypothetical protein [Clostridium estertheticum]NNU75073.1 hypothetical protein [Clostridium estertheticum]WBL48454.1 hypothetical protein LOR37_07305 [Clostridium estertheticum]